MAPMRKAVGSSRTFNARVFKSEEAEAHFKVVMKASHCRERGLEYKGRTDLTRTLMQEGWFADNIKRRQWEDACFPPESGCLTLVREFYANVKETKSDSRDTPTYQSYFRGTIIDYIPDTIKELLDLPTEE